MRILITGAGGPSAISVWKSLGHHHEVHMADMDPCAAGLYLVPEAQRAIVPRGDDPGLIPSLLELCRSRSIDLLIPTVDAELHPVACEREQFAASGTRVAVSSRESLALCRDKHALLAHLSGIVPVPGSIALTAETRNAEHCFPLFAKPRVSAGSRGAHRIASASGLDQLPLDGSYLLQTLLPGDEYSVDVYRTAAGRAIAAVPRIRMKIDSGIAVAARTVVDPLLAGLAVRAAEAAGVTYVSNVQFKRSLEGDYRLLEINPRFPGTLPITHAAGVDLPALLVAEMAEQPLPAGMLAYGEVMMVRYLVEATVGVDEWERLCSPATSG